MINRLLSCRCFCLLGDVNLWRFGTRQPFGQHGGQLFLGEGFGEIIVHAAGQAAFPIPGNGVGR